MRCYCCDRQLTSARKVKLRPLPDFDPSRGGPASAAYKAYREETTYRWAVICQACYSTLDNYLGAAEIGARMFTMAGASRGDRATTIDEAKYRKLQKQEAAKLGLDLKDESKLGRGSIQGAVLMRLRGHDTPVQGDVLRPATRCGWVAGDRLGVDNRRQSRPGDGPAARASGEPIPPADHRQLGRIESSWVAYPTRPRAANH
jgi:hypothetical protein